MFHTLLVSRQRRNCQRLHARRPPETFQSFHFQPRIQHCCAVVCSSVSGTTPLGYGSTRWDTLVLFTFVQRGDTRSRKLCVCLRALPPYWRWKISLFTVFLRVPPPQHTLDSTERSGMAVCCNLTSARRLTLEASVLPKSHMIPRYMLVVRGKIRFSDKHLGDRVLITNLVLTCSLTVLKTLLVSILR